VVSIQDLQRAYGDEFNFINKSGVARLFEVTPEAILKRIQRGTPLSIPEALLLESKLVTWFPQLGVWPNSQKNQLEEASNSPLLINADNYSVKIIDD
jgi:hypothetical protein